MPLLKTLGISPLEKIGFFTNASFWDEFKEFFLERWNEILLFLKENGMNLLISVIIILLLLLVTIIIERFSRLLIKKFGKKKEWADEIINGTAFIGRILVIIIGFSLIAAFGGLPAELGITLSTILGAAIGLASTKTVGNMVSGFAVLMARPFSLGDYVQIGDVEGIVSEMTVNYTKIITRKNTTVLISNQEIASTKVTRFGTEERCKTYTIYPEFNHDLTTAELARAFKKVIKKYMPEQVPDITYELFEVTRLGRKYKVSFEFDFLDDYFTIPSEFLSDLMNERDKIHARKQAQKKS